MFNGDSKSILEGVTKCVVEADFSSVLSNESPDSDQLEIKTFIMKNYQSENNKV